MLQPARPPISFGWMPIDCPLGRPKTRSKSALHHASTANIPPRAPHPSHGSAPLAPARAVEAASMVATSTFDAHDPSLLVAVDATMQEVQASRAQLPNEKQIFWEKVVQRARFSYGLYSYGLYIDGL